jgi:hypothetical protein
MRTVAELDGGPVGQRRAASMCADLERRGGGKGGVGH